ncbi:MAG: peptidylprolyl isomerase [Bacteroidota bacterium]
MKKFSFVFFVIAGIILTGKTSVNAQNNASVKKVQISTNYGTIKIKLYNETPKHRDNFIKLATSGYLNGTLFHRVIQGFMIQGGDPDSKTAKAGAMLGSGGPGYTIPAEFNSKLIHKKGALAAARDNNPQKASSGSQFYIVQGNKITDAQLDGFQKSSGWTYTKEQRNIYKTIGGTPSLDNGYTVFGEVYEGLDVIDKIAAVKKGSNDRPEVDVKMTVKVIK